MRLYYYTSKHFGMKSLFEKRLKVARYSDLNDPFELLPYQQGNRNNRKIFDTVFKAFDQAQGVLCFSESYKITLMWSHYADKHKGMCLGFDIPDDLVTKIKYRQKRLPPPSKIQSSNFMDEVLSVKHSGWRYEKEYRLDVPLKVAAHRDDIYYMNFDALVSLREIILGCKCKASIEDIQDSLGVPKNSVSIYAVRAAHSTYSMLKDLSRPSITVAGEKIKEQNKLASLIKANGLPDWPREKSPSNN